MNEKWEKLPHAERSFQYLQKLLSKNEASSETTYGAIIPQDFRSSNYYVLGYLFPVSTTANLYVQLIAKYHT